VCLFIFIYRSLSLGCVYGWFGFRKCFTLCSKPSQTGLALAAAPSRFRGPRDAAAEPRNGAVRRRWPKPRIGASFGGSRWRGRSASTWQAAGIQEQAEAAGDNHAGERQHPPRAHPRGRKRLRRLRLRHHLRTPPPAWDLHPQRQRHRHQCQPPPARRCWRRRHAPWPLRDSFPLRILPPAAGSAWGYQPHYLPRRRAGPGRGRKRGWRADRSGAGDRHRRVVHERSLREATVRRRRTASDSATCYDVVSWRWK